MIWVIIKSILGKRNSKQIGQSKDDMKYDSNIDEEILQVFNI